MRNSFLTVVIFAVVVSATYFYLKSPDIVQTKLEVLKENYSKTRDKKPVDHSKFEVLQKQFSSPQEVVKTCMSCHNEVHKELLDSPHFRWQRPVYENGRGVTYLGKANAINNFCIGVQGSEVSCNKCHASFGEDEAMLAMDGNAENIDCLVCHDNSATYLKGNNMNGYPDKSVDLSLVAKSVGTPTRDNCGVCHFFGGGGNNVKHGDLEKAQFHTTKEIDVHMADNGGNLICIDCHTTENHNIKGRLFTIESSNTNRVSCTDCHTELPHESMVLNEHTVKVACQTCHIPTYAKVNSVNTDWDWSTAGKLDKDGKPFEVEDSLGDHIYKSIKGTFKYARNKKPDYIWFNGTAEHYLLGDKISEKETLLVMNKMNGSYNDEFSQIIPVNIHYTKQPFDPVTRMLIQPKLAALKKGEGAYWQDFDWIKASEKGMEAAGLPFSGKLDWFNTVSYWPINHMVAPKENSLQCVDCHNSENSRLAGLNDFYMPARDKYELVDTLGNLMILLTIAGVLAHGSLRFYFAKKQK